MGMIWKRNQLIGSGTGASTLNFGKVSVDEYDGYLVTPSDSADLPNGPCDALACTGAGAIPVQLVAGGATIMATSTITSLTANTILPIQVSRVLATGATATGIYALYLK